MITEVISHLYYMYDVGQKGRSSGPQSPGTQDDVNSISGMAPISRLREEKAWRIAEQLFSALAGK